MRKIGGGVISASNGVEFSSVYKGENLADTVRAVACYSDSIILRHPEPGSTFEAAHALDALYEKEGIRALVVSGGDGIGEHPTQALLDLFTIEDYKKDTKHLDITLVGDLKHGRTVHSLGKLLSINGFDKLSINLVSPQSLKMPSEILRAMESRGIRIHETKNLMEVLPNTDVIYWTRIQEERFDDPSEYESVKDEFIMTPDILERAKLDTILMHPFPRKDEMGTIFDHEKLDRNPRSVYFQQMRNGMFTRMGLLGLTLGRIR